MAETPYYKFGYTSRAVGERMAALQTGNPLPLRCISTWEGTPADETMCRHHLSEYRTVHGGAEWFLMTEATIDRILQECPLFSNLEPLLQSAASMELSPADLNTLDIANFPGRRPSRFIRVQRGGTAVSIEIAYATLKDFNDLLAEKDAHLATGLAQDNGTRNDLAFKRDFIHYHSRNNPSCTVLQACRIARNQS